MDTQEQDRYQNPSLYREFIIKSFLKKPMYKDDMKCDYCQEEIKDDEEERTIFDGKDETITLCESCASHCLD